MIRVGFLGSLFAVLREWSKIKSGDSEEKEILEALEHLSRVLCKYKHVHINKLDLDGVDRSAIAFYVNKNYKFNPNYWTNNRKFSDTSKYYYMRFKKPYASPISCDEDGDISSIL